MSLPDYVRRRKRILDGAELPGCPAWGGGPAGVTAELRRPRRAVPLLRAGLTPAVRAWRGFEPTLRVGWSRTWRREHMSGSGEPIRTEPRYGGRPGSSGLAAYRWSAGRARQQRRRGRWEAGAGPCVGESAWWAGTATGTAAGGLNRTSKW
ncbi:hypothetical protein [Streptomyces sp. ST1020]|uniref:hypothetical protein n=1 Tax=Streptomyces sp. ST1020 TaxID=1848901 RepID=UPI0034C5D603